MLMKKKYLLPLIYIALLTIKVNVASSHTPKHQRHKTTYTHQNYTHDLQIFHNTIEKFPTKNTPQTLREYEKKTKEQFARLTIYHQTYTSQKKIIDPLIALHKILIDKTALLEKSLLCLKQPNPTYTQANELSIAVQDSMGLIPIGNNLCNIAKTYVQNTPDTKKESIEYLLQTSIQTFYTKNTQVTQQLAIIAKKFTNIDLQLLSKTIQTTNKKLEEWIYKTKKTAQQSLSIITLKSDITFLEENLHDILQKIEILYRTDPFHTNSFAKAFIVQQTTIIQTYTHTVALNIYIAFVLTTQNLERSWECLQKRIALLQPTESSTYSKKTATVTSIHNHINIHSQLVHRLYVLTYHMGQGPVVCNLGMSLQSFQNRIQTIQKHLYTTPVTQKPLKQHVDEAHYISDPKKEPKEDLPTPSTIKFSPSEIALNFENDIPSENEEDENDCTIL